MQYGSLLDKWKANKHSLKPLKTINLTVQLVTLTFGLASLCAILMAASMNLGADFCDKLTQKIGPIVKTVEVADGTTIPSLCSSPLVQRRVSQQQAKPPTEHVKSNETPSPLASAAFTIDISMQTQVAVPVHAKLNELVLMKSKAKMFEMHKLICTNEAIQVVLISCSGCLQTSPLNNARSRKAKSLHRPLLASKL